MRVVVRFLHLPNPIFPLEHLIFYTKLQSFWSSRSTPYGHSPHIFQDVPQQASWQQAPPSFQGFHLQESLGASASNRSPPVLQFGHLGGAVANTSSHGSESSSRYSTQQEKQSVNIEDLSARVLWLLQLI
ncbi:hypothetical protein SORBI_3003G163801 [Sorghum bicolor]|uniref:Uncharacterized protein n=1 Tax=Sorghum bicolor TaxID=4558 RepID=A0A1W0VXL6_SORBI|nr:hypothetical protein SORBI_3003G163801 [Sorghum bicolor]